MPLVRRVPHAAAGVLLAAGVAQAADAVTFVRMLRDVGPAAEANPLVAALAVAGHLDGLLAAKIGLVGLVVLVVSLCGQRYPIAGAVVATLAVGAGLLGAWTNVLVLVAPARW